MENALLEVKELKVNFTVNRKEITAIENLSFNIFKGETLGVVGESGCGKSVTAMSVMRLIPKNTGRIAHGSICLEGQDLTKLTESEMRNIRGNKISMIFQDPMTALNPVYKIKDQLMEMLLAHKKMPKHEAYEKCLSMLEKVGIPAPKQRMEEYPYQLSGGMRQRVMIAMALSTDPGLLIADEPTTALDVTIQAQILELMDKLKSDFNTAVMLITHDMGVIAEVADKVLVMYAGEMVEYGTVEELFTNPLHPYTRGLLNSIPRLDKDLERLYSIEGVVTSLSDMPKGCRFGPRCPECTARCKAEKPSAVALPNGQQVQCWKYQEKGALEIA